jgi:CRISPR-associated protein Csd1
MLLKHLYDLAHSPSRKEHFSDEALDDKKIRWLIELDWDGRLLGVQDCGKDAPKKKAPKTLADKKGKTAEFLADGVDAVFGLSPNPEEPKDAGMLRAKFDHFWGQIADAFAVTGHTGLKAVLAFKPQFGVPPSFLRQDGSKWMIRSASTTETKLGGLFTFRVGTDLLIEDETAIRPYWRRVFADATAAAEGASARGVCLITGEPDSAVAQTHKPRINGIPGVTSEAALVSFDKPAFGSYGLDQSQNAPCSVAATRAYCRALRFLVNEQYHNFVVGGTKFCFWAKEAAEAASLVSFLLTRPDPKGVHDFLQAPYAGFKDAELAKRDQFFAVALGGSSGRIVVRQWIQEPLDSAVQNFRQWFNDLEILTPARQTAGSKKRRNANSDWSPPPPLALRQLALTTVREEKDIDPETTLQLYRAALEGTAPAVSLIKPILDQLHSKLVRDEHYQLVYDQSRFALLKLILNRNRKDNTMTIEPKLTHDTDDPAYNCGRLLAILAAAQDKAHEYKMEGAGVAERYFGTASVSPASVFPLLCRLNRHHLNKIAKSDRFAGHERFIEEQIQQVLALFKPAKPGQPPVFPRTLDLQAQGRFALGFYQQQAADAAARQAAQNQKTKTDNSDSQNK